MLLYIYDGVSPNREMLMVVSPYWKLPPELITSSVVGADDTDTGTENDTLENSLVV